MIDCEVEIYADYTRHETERMRPTIEADIEDVRAAVLTLFPNARVSTFGSYATGLWLPTSDVDLVVQVRS